MGGGNVDAAGMTQEEVQRLPLERQFKLLGERYVEMERLFADAQRAIHRGPWIWGSKGLIPEGGPLNPWAMPGATMENSYFLETSRSIRLPGATGERTDTEPMVAHFEAQGWPTTVEETQTGSHHVKSTTAQGYSFTYMVEPNGWYTLDIYSRVFWCDRGALSSAVVDRVPDEQFDIEESPPGGHIPFPKWSDPVVFRDE